MKKLIVSEETLRRESALSFREKLEVARLLDRLEIDTLEVDGVRGDKEETVFNKTAAHELKHAAVCVRVGDSMDTIRAAWESVSNAKRAILQYALPLSTVRMEYAYHKKAEAMLPFLRERIASCRTLCPNVEFYAEDATRAEPEFLRLALKEAIEAGATRITVADSAGMMLPGEFGDLIASLREDVPGLAEAELMVAIPGELHMATACAMEAIRRGADGVKTESRGQDTVVLEKIAEAMTRRADYCGVEKGLTTTELHRTMRQILQILNAPKNDRSPFDAGVADEREDIRLNVNDDMAAVLSAVERLGYDLSQEDKIRVYQAWKAAAEGKGETGTRELEAIIATASLQVPQTYSLVSYVTNSGNVITSTAHVVLSRGGVNLSGVCLGDGPIDAAFLAIEHILGRHLELDDFQIQSVTEGREAMGAAIVKLRSQGRLYSGRGLSTDIIGASILAYVNALNKIVYEEENQ